METPYVIMVLSALGALLLILFGIFNNRVKRVEEKVEAHDKRLQTVEELQGSKLDTLIARVDKMEATLEVLKGEIHTNKNLTNQMSATLNAVNTWIINQK